VLSMMFSKYLIAGVAGLVTALAALALIGPRYWDYSKTATIMTVIGCAVVGISISDIVLAVIGP
jgi:hypothetical protein